MLTAVMLIDPAFFYPRLQTDPLNYVLKGKAFVETGSTAVSWAVNLGPFSYVWMPGVLRAPALAAFTEFDDQLRAMQVMNIPIVAAVALMSAYIFSWALPPARHAAAVYFAFAFTMLSPVWMANVFLPLADAPYAAATLGAVIVVTLLIAGQERIRDRPLLLAGFVLLFITAFLLRYTGVVLLVFAGVLASARWSEDGGSRRARTVALVAAALAVAVLAVMNQETILGRYLREPIAFMLRGEKIGMLVNILGAAMPSQIVPTFQLGFLHPPIQAIYKTSFSTTVPDMAWAGFGIAISLVIITGARLARHRFLPEIAYTMAALPVIGVMMPSTARYMMSYQPFFWICFYMGAAWLAHRHAPWLIRFLRSRTAVVSVSVAIVALVVGLRAWKVAGTSSERYFAVTAGSVPRYVSEVSGTFRQLRTFVESLPRERALLLSNFGTLGRWKAIAGRDYYYPDTALTTVVREKDVYLLVECGTLEACQAWDKWIKRAKDRVQTFGDFQFDSVFAAGSGRARVGAFRLTAAD
jgi:hypothetical protein